MQSHTLSSARIVSERLGELGRFMVVGVTATAIHLGTLFVLVEFARFWYVPATVCGFALAFIASFTLQKYWTFSASERGHTYQQLFGFFVMQIIALSVNAVSLYLLVEYLQWWYFGAQTVLLAVIAGATFMVSKYVIFKEVVA